MAEQLLTVYGTTWCGDTTRSRRFMDDNKVSYKWVDISGNNEATAFVEKVNNGNRSVPTIVFPDSSVLVEPSNIELEKKLTDTGLLRK